MGQPVDTRSDLYSLGVIFWEMLTGKKIYDGANAADDESFREKLPHDLRPRRADRRTDGDFAGARRGAREKQVGEVRARHEQYERNGAGEGDQRGPRTAGDVLVERRQRQARRPGAVAGGMRRDELRQPTSNRDRSLQVCSDSD